MQELVLLTSSLRSLIFCTAELKTLVKYAYLFSVLLSQ